MSELHERIAEIDRVWNDQIQYSNRQRQQRLHQCLATFLQDHDRTIEGLHDKLRTMGDETSRLQEHQATDGGNLFTNGDRAVVTAELDELWLVINELGLALARAWNLRAGTPEEFQQQFRSRGLGVQTVQKMCSAPGFWEEVEERLVQRRSARRRVSDCNVTGDDHRRA